MRVNSRKTNQMVMVLRLGLMVLYIKVILKMAEKMDKVVISGTRVAYILGSGRII